MAGGSNQAGPREPGCRPDHKFWGNPRAPHMAKDRRAEQLAGTPEVRTRARARLTRMARSKGSFAPAARAGLFAPQWAAAINQRGL
jgi:hypothetical protein